MELDEATPNIEDGNWEFSGAFQLKPLVVDPDVTGALNKFSLTVESAPGSFPEDVDSVAMFPKVRLVALVVVGVVKMLVPKGFISLAFTFRLALFAVLGAFVLAPLVRLAKKSNDDGCALLKPPKLLKTGFLDCKKIQKGY